jgi:hypothetical protein
MLGSFLLPQAHFHAVPPTFASYRKQKTVCPWTVYAATLPLRCVDASIFPSRRAATRRGITWMLTRRLKTQSRPSRSVRNCATNSSSPLVTIRDISHSTRQTPPVRPTSPPNQTRGILKAGIVSMTRSSHKAARTRDNHAHASRFSQYCCLATDQSRSIDPRTSLSSAPPTARLDKIGLNEV